MNSGAVAAPAPQTMIEVIHRAASDPNTDVAKMERLYAMLKEENSRIAEQRFNSAMAAAQAKMPLIVRKGKNPSTNSMFAKLEHIAAAILPVLEEYKFSLQFSEGDSPKPDKIRIMCRVSQDGGDGFSHSRDYHLDMTIDDKGPKGNDNKTKIHGEGSTYTYGRRYLTMMIFNLTIVGEDDDGNQGSSRPRSGPSTMQPRDLALKKYAVELWDALVTVRGDKRNWVAANQWLWKMEILDGAVPESAPDLTEEKFKIVIAKVKEKLK